MLSRVRGLGEGSRALSSTSYTLSLVAIFTADLVVFAVEGGGGEVHGFGSAVILGFSGSSVLLGGNDGEDGGE